MVPGYEYPAGRLTMKMKCPHCGVRGSVSDSLIGKRVKCPKCKEIFTAEEEGSSATLGNEPKKKSPIETAGQRTVAESSAGMTAMDEASLEEELAKIFDDMKKSTAEHETEPVGNRAAEEEDTGPLSEEELQSQLEDILDERCSVCGTIVGRATKHELYGNVYCSNCLPEIEEGADAAAGRHLTLSGDIGPKKKSSGFWRNLGAVLAGLVIIGLIVAGGYYLIQM
jgi:predicted Zn finger-like uncharacterized protein